MDFARAGYDNRIEMTNPRRRMDPRARERARGFLHLTVLALAVSCEACVAQAPTGPAGSSGANVPTVATQAVPSFRPTATIQDVMTSIIDPSADAIWDAVEITATRQGTVEKVPRTDEEWQALRARAITVLEASNLLLIPGRRVADPGRTTGDAAADLQPPQIEATIRREPERWAAFSSGLHDAARRTVRAAESKDVQALLLAGAALDEACEQCHSTFWYPALATSTPGSPATPPSQPR